MNTLDLATNKVKLKKVASTNGGEWQGPCPACGGTDRFHVWPNQNEDKGGYWCRGCERAGDNIQFLIDFEGMTFKEACFYLNITLPDRPGDNATPETPHTPAEFQPAQHQKPADLWQEKAEKFVTWAESNLKTNESALQWLAARGIDADAAAKARLGWNPGENGKDIFRPRKSWGLPDIRKEDGRPRMLWLPQGLVIPNIAGGVIQRIRIRRPEGEPRYYIVPGSSMATTVINPERRAFVLVEAELDAIACAAACELAGAVALGSLEGKPDAAAYKILKGALQILNALDYGDTGGGAKAAERALKWWRAHFDNCDRWPVPQGKDPGETFALGIDLTEWIKAGLPPIMSLDISEAQRAGNNSIVIPVKTGIQTPPESTPLLLAELWKLLKDNPGVKIINEPGRFTVLRNDRYVGGRINYLVFREKEVTDYLLDHPDQEIGWENLFKTGETHE